MKHLLIATLAFLIIQNYAQSQEMNFILGSEYQLPKKHEDIGFLGNEQEGYLQIGHCTHVSISLQKFTNEGVFVTENIIPITEMPKSYKIEQLLDIAGKHYWFFSTFDRETAKHNLFVQEIDIENNQFKGGARQLLSANRLRSNYTAKVNNTDAFDGYFYTFFFSQDRKKLLIKYLRSPLASDDRINHDIVGFNVYDIANGELTELWRKEVRMPYTEEKMDNDDYRVDRNGNAFLLAKVYSGTKKNKKAAPIYQYELLKWTKEDKDPTKIPFRFTDKFVRHAFVEEGVDGEIIVAGYYSKDIKQNVKERNGIAAMPAFQRTKEESVDGAFVLTLDNEKQELEPLNKGVYEFSAETIKSFESSLHNMLTNKNEKGEELEIHNMALKNFIVQPDGSLLLLGEEYTEQSTNLNHQHTTTYHYGDIYGMSINKEGDLNWMAKIPKRQEGGDYSENLSFKAFCLGSDTYVFFMDDAENMELAPDKRPTRFGGYTKNKVLVSVKITKNGTQQKSIVYNAREDKTFLSVKELRNIGTSGLITRSSNGKKCKIAKIAFQ